MDSRKIMDTELVSMDEVQVGDFVAGFSWSRPRLVVCVDSNSEGRVLTLEEPDASRANEKGLRVVGSVEWHRRARVLSYDDAPEFGGAPKACWRRYPNLTTLWAQTGD